MTQHQPPPKPQPEAIQPIVGGVTISQVQTPAPTVPFEVKALQSLLNDYSARVKQAEEMASLNVQALVLDPEAFKMVAEIVAKHTNENAIRRAEKYHGLLMSMLNTLAVLVKTEDPAVLKQQLIQTHKALTMVMAPTLEAQHAARQGSK